jgi:hypothetical protein
VRDEVIVAMFYDAEGNEMPETKLSRDFWNAMFLSVTLNPNHRGGAGTAKKRGGMTAPLSSGFVPRLTKAPRHPKMAERALRRAQRAAEPKAA